MTPRRPHLLMINQYFPPDTSATARITSEMAKKLAEDFQVTVLCGRPSYDPYPRHGWYLLRRETFAPGVRVIRVGSTTFHRRRMKGRLTNYFSYLTLALSVGALLRPDLVLVMTDPPFAHLAGWLLARWKRRPLVYNIRDFHPDMAVRSGAVQETRLVRLLDRLHRAILRRANAVIVLGEDMRRYAVQKGAPPERTYVVRDGSYLQSQNGEPPPNPAWIRTYRGPHRFVVGYAGNFGFAGAWDTVIQAVRQLRQPEIGFLFVGEGAEKPRIQHALSQSPNVRFLPYQPEHRLRAVLEAPDLHLVTLREDLEGLVVPSKLYPLLALGKPVVAVAPEGSDLARLVRQIDCGHVVDPRSPEALAETLRSLSQNPTILQHWRKNAQKAAKEFSLDTQFERLKTLMWRLV